jgi:hypothetical protein
MDHYLLIFMSKHETSYMIYVSHFLCYFFLILFREELKNRWLSLANDPLEIHNYFFFSLILLFYVFLVWRKSEKRVMMLNNNNNNNVDDDDVAKEIATLCVTIIAFSYEISFFFSSLIQIFFIYFSCFFWK